MLFADHVHRGPQALAVGVGDLRGQDGGAVVPRGSGLRGGNHFGLRRVAGFFLNLFQPHARVGQRRAHGGGVAQRQHRRAEMLGHGVHFGGERLGRRGGQRLGAAAQLASGRLGVGRGGAGEPGEPPHAAAHGFLADDGERPGRAGAGQVRAAAKLDAAGGPRVAVGVRQQVGHRHADADHAHLRRVLLAEDRPQAVYFQRVFLGHHLHVHAVVGGDVAVHVVFNRGDFFVAERTAVGEVEAQPLVVDQRAFLVGLIVDPVAQGAVHQVGGGVVVLNQRPPLGVNGQRGGHGAVEPGELAAGDLAQVQVHVADLDRVVDLDAGHRPAVLDHDAARVADLAAGLGVEGRGRQHHGHRVAGAGVGGGHVDAVALHKEVQRVVGKRALGLAVTGEVGGGEPARVQALLHAFQQALPGAVAAAGTGTRFGAGLVHLLVEARFVDREPALGGHQLGEVQREAVGVVEHKGVLGRDLPAGRQARGGLLEQRDAAVQGLAEGDFFFLDLRGDGVLHLRQLGEGGAEVGHHRGHEFVEERLADVERLPPVAHRPAQDAAQHVAAALVAAVGAVGQGEGQRADVVGDHAVGHVDRVGQRDGVAAGGVGPRAGDHLHGVKQWAEHVGVVVAVLALQHAHDALEAHACVHVFRGQGLQLAALQAVELDKDQVPDLDHVRVVGVDLAAAAQVVGAVVVQLAARPAGAGVAHLPEVVFLIARVHALGRQHLQPHVAGL